MTYTATQQNFSNRIELRRKSEDQNNPDYEEWDGIFLEDALGLTSQENDVVSVPDIFQQVKSLYPNQNSNAQGIKIDDGADFFNDLYSELDQELSDTDKTRIHKILTDAGFSGFGDMAKKLFGTDNVMDEQEFETMLGLVETITGVDVTQSNNKDDKDNKKALSVNKGFDKDKDGVVKDLKISYDDGSEVTIVLDIDDDDPLNLETFKKMGGNIV